MHLERELCKKITSLIGMITKIHSNFFIDKTKFVDNLITIRIAVAGKMNSLIYLTWSWVTWWRMMSMRSTQKTSTKRNDVECLPENKIFAEISSLICKKIGPTNASIVHQMSEVSPLSSIAHIELRQENLDFTRAPLDKFLTSSDSSSVFQSSRKNNLT